MSREHDAFALRAVGDGPAPGRHLSDIPALKGPEDSRPDRSPRPRGRPQWRDGALVGLGAALLGALTLLVVGAVSGRGLHVLGDAGMAALPSAVRAATGAPAALSYVLSHTALYVLAGVVVLALARLADRFPAVVAGLVLLVAIVELGFLQFTTEAQAMGRLDEVTWRALLIAHGVADVAFALGIVRVHPGLRRALVRGYEE